MNDTVLGALIGCCSALLGGGLTLLSKYLTLQHSGKLELKKLTLSELREQRLLIGKFKKELVRNWTNENIGGNELILNAEYNKVSEFLTLNSHLFIDSEQIEHLQNNIESIENDIESTNSMEIMYRQVNLINEFKNFINLELKKITQNINKLTGIE